MNFKSTGGSAAESLARQSSVYSLTFDEFQTSMGGFGKDFGSMNMDELLKNIWTAEEAQAMTSAAGSVEAAAGPSGYGGLQLQRQGSLTLPRTLSQKTVDEVWRDLIGVPGGGAAGEAEFRQQRQSTLGEMTLEEFLVRAGVVREEMNQCLNQNLSQSQVINQPPPPRPILNGGANATSSIFGDLPVSNGNQGIVLGFSQLPAATNLPMAGASAPARPYLVPLAPLGNASDLGAQQRVRGGGILGFGDQSVNNGLMQGFAGLGGGGGVAAMSSPANQISSDGLAKGNGDLSLLSPLPYVYAGGIRGRKCSGAVEKVVERRQKRMIKNRESAARSRSRKQAYTMELEAEVAKLKDQNQELQKKQAEILEMQKSQVLEIINQPHGYKKRCLRRTHTGPW